MFPQQRKLQIYGYVDMFLVYDPASNLINSRNKLCDMMAKNPKINFESFFYLVGAFSINIMLHNSQNILDLYIGK